MRNAGEYTAAALIALVNGYYMWHFHSLLMRLGSGLIVAGIVYVVLTLRRRGRAQALPAATTPSLNFLIAEQRDLLRSIWDWYLSPLFPGVAVFLFGASELRRPDGSLIVAQRSIAVTAALVVAGFALIAFFNQVAARRLGKQIHALEGLRR
jgi:hypothetical protein